MKHEVCFWLTGFLKIFNSYYSVCIHVTLGIDPYAFEASIHRATALAYRLNFNCFSFSHIYCMRKKKFNVKAKNKNVLLYTLVVDRLPSM